MPPSGLTQTGPEMYSWYLATESHTRRVARICSGMHRVCTRSSVTRRLRWSWVPASHHRRAMTRRLSTAERARSLDCEEESAAGKDDGRSLNALARAQLQRTWGEVGLCAAGPSKAPTLPITPPTSLPAVAPPAIPLSKEMEGSSSHAKQQRSSGSGGREGDIESGRRSARQPRERARGRPRAAVWERESEEQQQPSASRGVSGEDPETAALRKLKEHNLSQRRPRC